MSYNGQKLVEMKNICKSFSGVQVLKDVNYSIESGEVHALIGENGAGKSTLMKILLGIYTRDSGEVLIEGNPVVFDNPGEALGYGISMIHQEISLIHTVDVAENIWLGREKEFTKYGMIDMRRRYERTKELLEEYGIPLEPSDDLESLSIAKLQLIELARALSYNSRLIVMDEPTSALTDSEVQLLFNIIRSLKERGTSTIFISHKLEEMFKVCDRVTVLRDGEFIGTRMTGETDLDEIISMIVGRSLENIFPPVNTEIGEEALRVEGLTRYGKFEDVSFSVHKGEVLGFCGLMGAGRTEVMTCIFGADRYDKGDIYVKGMKVTINNPKEAIKLGIGMVTEDRLRLGAFHDLMLMENTSMAVLPSKYGFIDSKKERTGASWAVEEMHVVFSSMMQAMRTLSGGNQQKVILSRWMLANPEILILDEPTRGIDVGSKSEIYAFVNQLAKSGIAVILVSSELPELLGMSNRIIAFKDGRMVYETDRENATQEKLIASAYGIEDKVTVAS